jgi:DNA polymerase-4
VFVRDVLAAHPADLARWLGPETARRVLRKARGESDGTVEPRAPAKQVSREETFDHDLSDVVTLRRELRTLADRVAADLRGDALTALTVTVKVKDKAFVARTASQTLGEPIESGAAVAKVALALLEKLRTGWTVPVRLAGVALSNFRPARDAEQLTIFSVAPAVESTRDRALSNAMDRVRQKYGDASIASGVPRTVPLGEKGARKPR